MKDKVIFQQLNIFSQCKKYGLPFWQCPQFLFIVMGCVTIITAVGTYLIGTRYFEDPQTVVLIVLGLSTVSFVISFVINHSLEALAEASRMKTEFVSIVSHQLRAPLTNLKWCIELMISEGIDNLNEEQMLNYIKIFKENNKRMEELINDLLVVSRIDKEEVKEKKQKIDLVKLTKDFLPDFSAFAESSNIKLIFNYEKDLPLLFIDTSQIKLVIENFIDNAIKYTKKGGNIYINIRKENSNIYFEVRDEGVGIPLYDQKFIFQKFFRASNALKYQTQGSGLGLFIAKAVIEKSGGQIGFNSQEDKGSTFWFKLPIKRHVTYNM